MKRQVILTFLVISFPLSTYATVFGGSNPGSIAGYPSHKCTKPTEPYKPCSFNSQWEVDSYNSEVNSYNSELQQYSDCINEYIENANNDIELIREKIQEAQGSYY